MVYLVSAKLSPIQVFLPMSDQTRKFCKKNCFVTYTLLGPPADLINIVQPNQIMEKQRLALG